MRHQAIYEVYPSCIGITDGIGAFGPNNELIEVDESLIAAKIAELKAAEPLRLLRQQRNRLLTETDWRMVSDYPDSNQSEWQTYRQSLRDITTQSPSLDSDGNLTGITWPTPPND